MLLDKCVGPCLISSFHCHHVISVTQDNGQDSAELRSLAYPLKKRHAVHIGHLKIRQNHSSQWKLCTISECALPRKIVHRFNTVPRTKDRVMDTCALQSTTAKQRVIVTIVHEQDSVRHIFDAATMRNSQIHVKQAAPEVIHSRDKHSLLSSAHK